MKLNLLAGAALALASLGASAAGNLVANGSFEADVVGSGSYSLVPSPTDWGFSGGAGLEIRDNIVGTAEDGNQFIELDGNENDTITQSLATQVGQQYTFSFYYSDRPVSGYNPDGIVPASSQGVGYSIGGLSGSVNDVVNLTSDNVWKLFTGTFVATSSTTLLTLTGTGTSDALGSSIDNVSVTAVPEPAVVALMASGLALIGLSRRRQNRR